MPDEYVYIRTDYETVALPLRCIDLNVKHVRHIVMKTITIRDLRQRWPEAEAALAVEDEIIITRDSKPVARLLRVIPPESNRPRWDLEEHRRWTKTVFGKKVVPSSDDRLAADRADRKLISTP